MVTELKADDVGLSALEAPASATGGRGLRVGVFGLFGSGNFGNDASLDAELRALRRTLAPSEIVCICGVPEGLGDRFGVPLVRMTVRPKSPLALRINRLLFDVPRELASMVRAFRTLRKLDVLVVPGTGILDDFGAGPRGMPWWLFRWCALARLLRVRIVMVSIGAGPIHHPVSRWLMTRAAAMAEFRSYRDERSRAFMASLGADVSRDPVTPDIAFALPPPPGLQPPAPEGSKLTVGLGVMAYNGWRGDSARDERVFEDYLDNLAGFARWLLREGHDLRLLAGDTSDQRAVEALRNRLPVHAAGRVRWDDSATLQDVMEQIADTDVVVATRFHNVVAALRLGRAVMSLGYAAKNADLLADMGLGDFCSHVEQIDLEALKAQFLRLLAERKRHEAHIAARAAEYGAILDAQDRDLARRIGGGRPAAVSAT